MKTLYAALLTLPFTASAIGQTFHIESIADHLRDRTENPAFTEAHTRIITGTADGKRYSLAQCAVALCMPYRFQVGQDYEVRKITDKSVSLWVDVKGRRDHEDLSVKEIAEAK